MKIYYVENLAYDKSIEQFYVVDTGFGLIELDDHGDNHWTTMEDFKACWKDFDKNAIMVRVL